MNVAVILAGGYGTRMHNEIPKQFIKVEGKPILSYTLSNYENHSLIDVIEVVCLDGWQNVVWDMKDRYNISKLKWITSGGITAQESIRNGVYNLEGEVEEKDIVIIHDGIRPLVDDSVLDDVIKKCERYGNSVSSLPYNEQIFLVGEEEGTTTSYIPRETLRRVSTPQAYRYDLLLSKYKEAFSKGIGINGSSYTNTMMVDLGVKLYFAEGSDRNIKLTTPVDLELFKCHLKISQVKDRDGNEN